MAIATHNPQPLTRKGYYIYLTEACNLRCDYCFVTDKSNQRHLTEDTARHTLDYVAKDAAACTDVYVHFFGGEPLLRPAMVEFLAGQLRSWSVEHGIRLRLGVTTNGTLLTVPVCEMLRRHDVGVQLSLDGSRRGNDVHRQFMGGTQCGLPSAGAFDRVKVANYIRYFGKGRPNCRMTVTVHNLQYLAESIEELHGIGFQSFSVIPDSDCGSWAPEHFVRYEAELGKVFEYWSAHEDIGVNVIEQTIGKLTRKKEQDHLCPAGRNVVGITVDGDIYPCHDFAGKFAAEPSARAVLLLGNVHTGCDAARYAFGNPVALDQVSSGSGHKCATCWARWACSRGCPYMNYARARDVRVANAVYCESTRLYASLALRWMSALGRFRFVDLDPSQSRRRQGRPSGKSERAGAVDISMNYPVPGMLAVASPDGNAQKGER